MFVIYSQENSMFTPNGSRQGVLYLTVSLVLKLEHRMDVAKIPWHLSCNLSRQRDQLPFNLHFSGWLVMSLDIGSCIRRLISSTCLYWCTYEYWSDDRNLSAMIIWDHLAAWPSTSETWSSICPMELVDNLASTDAVGHVDATNFIGCVWWLIIRKQYALCTANTMLRR